MTYLFKTQQGAPQDQRPYLNSVVFKIRVMTHWRVVKLFQWLVTSSDFVFYGTEHKIPEYTEHSKNLYR